MDNDTTTPTTPAINASAIADPNTEAKASTAERVSFDQAVKMLIGGGVTEDRAKGHARDAIEHRDGFINFQGVTVKVFEAERSADEPASEMSEPDAGEPNPPSTGSLDGDDGPPDPDASDPAETNAGPG